MTPLDILNVVRRLVALILDIVPHDVASQLLTDEAVRRQNAIADGAELTKFGEDKT